MNNVMPDANYHGTELDQMASGVNYKSWIVDEIKPYIRGHVAEVGAGIGTFTLNLLPLSDRITIIEPAGNLFSVLSERFRNNGRIHAERSFFPDIYMKYAGMFDSIVYVNVLEHVGDDSRELNCIHTALKSGGHVCIYVPAMHLLYSEFDRSIGHVRRYAKKRLVAMIRDAGFQIEKSIYMDILGIIPWFLVFVLLRKKNIRAELSIYDKIVIPVIRGIEQHLRPIIGKNLLVVGRKT